MKVNDQKFESALDKLNELITLADAANDIAAKFAGQKAQTVLSLLRDSADTGGDDTSDDNTNEKYPGAQPPRNSPQENRRAVIFDEINKERERQIEKFGVQHHDPFVWLAIIGEEKGEADEAALKWHFEGQRLNAGDYRKELIEVAATTVSAIESLDRDLD